MNHQKNAIHMQENSQKTTSAAIKSAIFPARISARADRSAHGGQKWWKTVIQIVAMRNKLMEVQRAVNDDA